MFVRAVVASVVSMTLWVGSATAQEASLGGFIPYVGMGMTGEFKTIDDINFGATFFISDPANFVPGNVPMLGTGGNPYYEMALFDSGAATHIITNEAFNSFDIAGNGLRGTNTQTVGGATGLVELEINDAAGVYVAGMGDRASAGSSLAMNRGALRGQTSFATLSAPQEWELPSIIGLPMLSHHSVAIRNDQPQVFELNGRTVRTPQVDFFDLGDGADEGIIRRAPLNIRPGVGFVQGPFYVYDINVEDILGGGLSFHDNPASPSVMQDQTGVGGSLFIDVNLERDGNVRDEREFLFDTGADLTVISEIMAKRLGFDPVLDTPDFILEVEGSGGVSTGVPGIYLDELSIDTVGGNFVMHNVPVAVLDVTDVSDPGNIVDGIIGMHLFNGRNLVIDANPSLGQGGVGPSVFISDPVTVDHTWVSPLADASWHASDRWSANSIPDMLAKTTVRNVSGTNQVARVMQDAEAHTITVGGTPSAEMQLIIESGNTLTTFGETKVEQGGVVQVLAGARLDTHFINLEEGTLTGGGEIEVGSGPLTAPVRNISGRIEPGDGIGVLTIAGDLSNLTDGTVAFELGGTTPGDDYDQLTVDRFAFLAGILEVALVDGGDGLFAPSIGQTFTLITAGTGVQGQFDQLLLPSAYTWDIDYLSNSVRLEVTGLNDLAGDFNGDGVVDAGDYTVWRDTHNATGPGLAADANNDLVVNHDDYAIWRANFGATSAGLNGGNLATVPEPSSAIAIAAGASLVVLRRRRANRKSSRRGVFV